MIKSVRARAALAIVRLMDALAFDPDQIRDRRGRWVKDPRSGARPSEGGGTGAGGSGGVARKRKPTRHAGRKSLTDRQFQERADYVDRSMSAALKAHSTDRVHAPGGVWTAERDRLHRQIADDLYARAADVPNEGKAVMAGGLGGAGKALSLDTEVPTPNGWATMGSLVVDDEVFGTDGHPYRVVATTGVMRDERCYRITFSDGTKVVADSDHLWAVHNLKSRRPPPIGAPPALIGKTDRVYSTAYPTDDELVSIAGCAGSVGSLSREVGVSRGSLRDYLVRRPELSARVRTAMGLPAGGDHRIRRSGGGGEWGSGVAKVLNTDEIAATFRYRAPGGKWEHNYSLPVASPVQYPQSGLPVPPYLMGVWLGDGDSLSPRVTSDVADSEIREKIASLGWPVVELDYPSLKCGYFKVFAPGDSIEYGKHSSLVRYLRELRVYGDKHIPQQYLTASEDDRWALLAGLLDTDGTIDARRGRCVTFGHVVSERLARGVRELVCSLGMKAGWSTRVIDGKTYYAVSFAPDRVVFELGRKAELQRPLSGDRANNEHKAVLRYITNVEQVESVPVRCITVDSPDSLFLITRSYLPTHNSTVLKKYAGIDPSQYLTVNPDDVKEEMVKRGLIPEIPGAEDLSPMERSALVHEESSRIAQMVAQRAYADQKNMIWDITMSSQPSIDSRVSAMREAGYGDINGVFVDIPTEVSVDRALSRYRRGIDQWLKGDGEGGRYVPPRIIRAQQTSGGSTVNRESFDNSRGQFDGWSVYDNSVTGRAPQLIDKSN